jgi:hypothetical protein
VSLAGDWIGVGDTRPPCHFSFRAATLSAYDRSNSLSHFSPPKTAHTFAHKMDAIL